MIRSRGFAEAKLSLSLYHLEHLENFLDELQSLWDKRLNEYEGLGNEIEDEHTRQEFFEFYFDDWAVYRDDYPRIAKYSVVVSSHSYFEKICSDYYNKAQKDNPNWKVINKPNKHALDYVKYFKRNLGGKAVSEKIYQQFLDFNYVRNRIVHSNGEVDIEKNKRIMAIVSKVDGIKLNQLDEIVLEIEYIKGYLVMLSELIVQIHSRIYAK